MSPRPLQADDSNRTTAEIPFRDKSRTFAAARNNSVWKAESSENQTPKFEPTPIERNK
jgi:hypothetical protein